jgi:Na+/H+ antiporter NhaA
VFVDEGIVAVATCQAVVAALFALIGMAIATRMLELRPARLAAAILPAAVAAGGMGAAVLAVTLAIGTPWAVLAVGIPAGAAVYAALLRLTAPDVVRDLRSRVADARRR